MTELVFWFFFFFLNSKHAFAFLQTEELAVVGRAPLKRDTLKGEKGLVMDGCLFFPVKNKFYRLRLDINVDSSYLPFAGEGFLFIQGTQSSWWLGTGKRAS